MIRKRRNGRAIHTSAAGVLALCPALVLSGCFGSKVEPYPANWAPAAINASHPCEIGGRYSVEPAADDASERPAPPRKGTDSAWGMLVDVVDGGIEGFPHVDHTSLQIVGGRDDTGAFVDVSAEERDVVVASRRLREGQHYRCTQEGIEITRGWYGVNVNLGAAFIKYRLVFYKDLNDGALVLHSLVQERGLPLFVIPVWASGESWTRWSVQTSVYRPQAGE